MTRSWEGKPRGILRHEWEERRVTLGRYVPGDVTEPFVEYFWTAHWDLRDRKPRTEVSLPHPCVHVVVERGRSNVVGVIRGRFERRLEGLGQVFGIKFRPGGLYPLVGWPVSRITDRVLPIGQVFGEAGEEFERDVLATENHGERVAIAETFLRARLPASDANTELAELAEVRAITEHVLADPEVTKVDDLVARFGGTARRLQRLFQRTVGVGPKWVIQRYRLHEAVERMGEDEVVDWASLALELGYFDQAHFIRDFKSVVGTPPATFAKSFKAERNGRAR